MTRMYDHFTEVAPVYREIRTTDLEPILYIRDRFEGQKGIRAVDVGCGAGRYDLLLLQQLPGLQLTCVDINESMLAEATRYLRQHGMEAFETICTDIGELSLPANSVDFVFTFNAIHHFDAAEFLEKAAARLRDGGYVFIYTRLRNQNSRNIWGRFFPDFSRKETRLYDLGQFEAWGEAAASLVLESIESFQFERVATMEQLVHVAEQKHYSTFSLYKDDEFSKAIAGFRTNLQTHHDDLNHIEWFDEYAMIVFKKDNEKWV